MNVEVDPTEDTEWNDILRSHGIIPERPPSPSQQIEEALQESLQRAHENRLENKTLDELEDLEDDEDEEFLEVYRQKRMKEMQQQSSREKFGDLVTISKPQYTDQVTNASANDTYVFLHIMYPGVPESKLVTGLFRRTAEKFRDIKFVEIDARQINENYRPENCPTILVYYNTNFKRQFVTLKELGGKSTNLEDIEEMLIKVGAVKDNDRRLIKNEDDGVVNRERKSIRINHVKERNQYDEDDDDFYD